MGVFSLADSSLRFERELDIFTRKYDKYTDLFLVVFPERI